MVTEIISRTSVGRCHTVRCALDISIDRKDEVIESATLLLTLAPSPNDTPWCGS